MSTDTLDLRQIRADRSAIIQVLTDAGAVFRGDDCKCVFHPDRNASAGIYQKDGVWRYKCHGCDAAGDVIDVQAKLHNRSVADELRDMRAAANGNGHNGHAAKNGKAKTPANPAPIDWGAMADRFRQQLTADRLEALASSTGLPSWAWESVSPGWAEDGDLRTLRAGGEGWADNRPTGAWAIAEHASGAIVGLSLRAKDGRKGFPSGAHRGIVLSAGLAEMPGIVIIVEGASDVVASVALGIPAAGRASNRSGASDLAELLQSREVLIVGENDKKPDETWPGRDGAMAVAQQLANRWGKPVRWTLPPVPAKDIRDWFCTQAAADLDAKTLKGFGAELMDALEQAAVEVSPETLVDSEPAKPLIVPIGIGDFIEQNPTLHPAVVEGFIREGETTNIISASKIGKTHFVWDLAFSVATGRVWLDHLQTHKGRVLAIDNELHPATLADRQKKIMAARGIMREEVTGQIDVLSLRGKLLNIFDIQKLLMHAMQTGAGVYKLVVIDALYRTLPDDVQENDNAAMTRVYNLLDSLSGHLKAGIVLIHHASKGNQSGKEVTDVGSGAGSQSRAADNHIVLRPHEEQNAVVMEARLRSWKSPEPTCLKWEYPLWIAAPDLDPAKLRRDPSKGGRPPKVDGADDAKAQDEPWTPERFASTFITDKPQRRDVLTSKANRAGIPFRIIEGLVAEAEDAGLIFRHPTGTTTGVAFANVKPTLFSGVEGEERERTHTPHTPRARVRPKAATRGK